MKAAIWFVASTHFFFSFFYTWEFIQCFSWMLSPADNVDVKAADGAYWRGFSRCHRCNLRIEREKIQENKGQNLNKIIDNITHWWRLRHQWISMGPNCTYVVTVCWYYLNTVWRYQLLYSILFCSVWWRHYLVRQCYLTIYLGTILHDAIYGNMVIFTLYDRTL